MKTNCYQVSVIDEVDAPSPKAALKAFLDRLANEETSACVEVLETGEKFFIECQTGECLSMKV